MRYQSYLNTAQKIIETYTGAEPLSAYLKKFFAADKKYGSRDRKQISTLCYHYYRLGKSAKDIPVDERILIATFLCEQNSSEFLHFHKPEWNDKITTTIPEKLLIINSSLLINDIFPWSAELSDGIDHAKFAESFLHQPDLFLRIRPGKKEIVLKKLEASGLSFTMINEDCIALPNSSKIDVILEIDNEVVIQDASSQKVLQFLNSPRSGIQHPVSSIQDIISAWDCCAASGGKSILLYDMLNGNVELTVSDIRESIIANLKKRFSAAGIRNYHSFIADLSVANCQLPTADCQLLLCDAPCTGSGTWSRTPEQLYYFKPSTISAFSEQQKKIVAGAIPQLQKGGSFFYITCSVFKKENEEIVEFIKEKFQLQLVQLELKKGYDKKADSMFVAVFVK